MGHRIRSLQNEFNNTNVLFSQTSQEKSKSLKITSRLRKGKNEL